MSDSESLDGAVALVTGASSGIGRATATRLAADGASVALAARREGRLRDLAADIAAESDVETVVVPTDVTDYEAVESAVERTVSELGGLDVVVNNAGTGETPSATASDDGPVPVEDVPREQYHAVTDVNVDGMYHVSRASLPHLREGAGSLVFVGSFAGQYPRPEYPIYAASKWWTRGFALSVAGQAGPDGVAVTVVNPTVVRTAFGSDHSEDVPMDRFSPGEVTEPEEVADAIAFAASQDPPTAVTELDLYRRDKFADF
ncbi:SDR family oxidoreductase [Haloarculaceae archaeon H-GB2-1]|nr:SDR family NAD(P)-dependent oxidoreductase [Haloarculaceae archaeon H-GB1-1]MEA5386967.1 SDR family oxidoreductase [Haloarculaceae archaeon H-GB11]MEA5408469.1 SDR family oxidoreductase [Haloarculaceae archaeon H-GB2-1]